MTSLLRILDTGLRSARWNVAMTAALTGRHADDAASDTLRFHRYPSCVLLGFSQCAPDVVDFGYCRQEGLEIAHRVTGGGAVYMSSRMLAWDVVVDRRVVGGNLATATQRLCESVAAGLAWLGCAARFRPANDVEIGGLKVSGSSSYAEGRTVTLQGTVLVEDDVPVMSRALRIPDMALRQRVTCLAAVLGRTPVLAEVQSCLVRGLVRTLGHTPSHQQPSPADLAAADVMLTSASESAA